MTQAILVVDDDPEMRALLKSFLAGEGFLVTTAGDGREALFLAREMYPDLIILDLMMPEMGGYEFLRLYRRQGKVAVILLTAKLKEDDKVQGLELGADDYVTKPFSVREMAARARAVLRRAGQLVPEPEMLRAADITLDVSGRITRVGDQRIDLTPSEFALLTTLMSAPGRAFSRLELLDRLGDGASEGYERTVDVHIRRLRTKIEPEPRSPRYV
jgi:DNA-binding response OmpR family regulator